MNLSSEMGALESKHHQLLHSLHSKLNLSSEKGALLWKHHLLRSLYSKIEASNWVGVDLLLNHVIEQRIVAGGERLPSSRLLILYKAVRNGMPLQILEKLLSLIDMKYEMKRYRIWGSERTPFHSSVTMPWGVEEDALFLLATAYPEGLCIHSWQDNTPLDLLMKRNDRIEEEVKTALMRRLLHISPEAAWDVNGKGQNLLHRALDLPLYTSATRDHLFMPTMLLKVRPGMAAEKDNGGNTPLHQAVLRYRKASQTYLERHTSVFEPDDEESLKALSRDLTRLAVMSRDIIEQLVLACPQALNMVNIEGNTPFDMLVPDEYEKLGVTLVVPATETIVMLMTGRPCKLSQGAPSLAALLHLEYVSPAIAIFLVHQFRHQLAIPDASGRLPLHILVARPPRDPTMTLPGLKAMVELYPDACRTMDGDGLLPLQVMMQNGHTWPCGMKEVFCVHPSAVVDLNIPPYVLCTLLENINGKDNFDVRFRLLKEAPFLFQDITMQPRC